jgi:hypothetical protein
MSRSGAPVVNTVAAGDEWAQQRGVGFQAWWSMPLGEEVGWTPVRGANST